MIQLLTAFFQAATEACKAYAARLQYDLATANDRDEDEIQTLLSRGTPADNLRASILSGRVKRRRAQQERPA